MEGHTRVLDKETILHKEAAPVAATQDGSVSGVPKIHLSGKGMLAPGSYIIINVRSSDDTDGDETYALHWMLSYEGGPFETFATFPIPAGIVDQQFLFPVSNRGWNALAYDAFKVNLELGGTTPSLDAVVRLGVVGI